jgi:enoyl-CoA hydratase
MSLVDIASNADVVTLTLNNPERRNSINATMVGELGDALRSIEADQSARTLIVAGAGTSFCAGADLPATFGDVSRSVADIRADLQKVYKIFLRLRALPIPTLAAVQGPAVGAGLNLAMACDIRIAGPHAKFIANFSKIGLHPGGGATHFLVRALGTQRAMALLLNGGAIDAAEAVRNGLALEVAEEPLAAAREMAARFAALDPRLARGIKVAVQTAATADFQTVLELESWAQAASAKEPALQEVLARFTSQ